VTEYTANSRKGKKEREKRRDYTEMKGEREKDRMDEEREKG
jgi:hypothetical protein